MSLLLTVYNTPAWKTLIDSIGLPLINEATPVVHTKAAVLQPTQALPTVSALLLGLSTGQVLWVAAVQAEYYLANAIENGTPLVDAAKAWELKTTSLLNLQRQQRQYLRLFNIHQALALPNEFRECLSKTFKIHEYPAQTINSNLPLLIACQYLAQQPELRALNTRLQASVLPLFDNEKLVLNLDQILLQSHSNNAALHERDAAVSQLQHVQEQLESISAERDLLFKNLEKTKTDNSNEQKKSSQGEVQLKKANEEISKASQVLEKLKAELKSSSEERDLILLQMQQVQEQLEQHYLQLQAEQQNNKHAMLAHDKQHAREIAKLENELHKTKARAASAEHTGLLLQQEITKLRNSTLWKATAPVRILGDWIKKTDKTQEKLLQETALLLTSEYFDIEWYLRTYTDIAESQMNPAEHYLLYGATEGHLPGPLFDGNWYLQQYPDVAASGVNPLLHFIKFGQQEGRNSSPTLLTNNSQNTEEE